MASADLYRKKAQEFLAMASGESNPNLQIAYASMAQGYLRLATLAEQNNKNDVVYETPPPHDPPGPTT